MKIAILIASFNRKEKTLACLKNVESQKLPEGYSYEIFLTDDNSKDGTSDAIRKQFPYVNILNGTGSMFWAGGMINSWRAALKKDFDYYLLLNDDTFLYNNSIHILILSNLSFLEKKNQHSITIGNTKDSETGKITYGGKRLYSKYRVNSFLVKSHSEILECDLGDANIMFVPKEIVKKIGILSDAYTHAIADHDYTRRAVNAGFKIAIAPGVLGSCTYDHGLPWKSQSTSFKDRLKYLYSVKGLNYKEYLFYIRKFFPYYYPEAFLKLWIKTLFPVVYTKFKKFD